MEEICVENCSLFLEGLGITFIIMMCLAFLFGVCYFMVYLITKLETIEENRSAIIDIEDELTNLKKDETKKESDDKEEDDLFNDDEDF